MQPLSNDSNKRMTTTNQAKKDYMNNEDTNKQTKTIVTTTSKQISKQTDQAGNEAKTKLENKQQTTQDKQTN